MLKTHVSALTVQRVQRIRSCVAVMECVYRHVSCVMDTHNVVITLTKETVRTTVSIYCLYLHVHVKKASQSQNDPEDPGFTNYGFKSGEGSEIKPPKAAISRRQRHPDRG